jgi:DNA-binding NarL/FixJ family response regulator
MENIRIILADDHALVREMLCAYLQQNPGFQVVATASSAKEAMQKCVDHQPNVVVMDIDMPGLICFDAARRILSAQPEVKLIFLSAYTHDHYIEQALQVGAVGYLTKSEPPQNVAEAIRSVAEGRAYFSEEVRSRIVFDSNQTRLAPKGRSRGSLLTPREVEVVRYVARGLAKKEIASIMHVSLKTVEKHTDNLMQKLDIHDRVELARFAIREGLAEP